MSARIPDEAFDFYLALGPDRTYEAVAEHFGASLGGIKKAALRESWQARLAEIEDEVQARLDQRFADEVDEMRGRHLKTVRAMMGRALKGLQQYPLASGMEAIRAAELAIKLERLIMGEASERTAVTAEETVRREMSRWLVGKDEEVDLRASFRSEPSRDSKADAALGKGPAGGMLGGKSPSSPSQRSGSGNLTGSNVHLRHK